MPIYQVTLQNVKTGDLTERKIMAKSKHHKGAKMTNEKNEVLEVVKIKRARVK